jgi:formiminoglutamase
MYLLPDKNNWDGRIDSHEDKSSFRFHQMVALKDADKLTGNETAFNVVGFESDEGVRRNKGRTGAAKGPNEIKRALAKLPYNIGTSCIADVGNIRCEGENLEGAQSELGNVVTKLLQKSAKPIILGGGHETLYGHYLGVREYLGADVSLGIINIDAHFDMRDEQTPSSGTMFRQIMEQDKKAGYLCLGIQEFGNTQSLFKTADAYGCSYVLEESIADNKFRETFEIIDTFAQKYDFIMLTLCMDSIVSSEAPGVSAPSPFGLEPKTVRKLLRYIAAKENLTSFDISEVNPLVDESGKTVRLAALLVAEVMKHFNGIKVRS